MTKEQLEQKIYYCKVNDLLYDKEKYEYQLSKLNEESNEESPVNLTEERTGDRRVDPYDETTDGLSSGRKENEFKRKG
jgi:hypothetical protein